MNEVSTNGHATAVAADWLGQFDAALAGRDIAAAVRLFHTECYWRDLLSFTWNIATFEGPPAIAAMLEATLGRTAPHRFVIEGEPEIGNETVGVWFTFETAVARGRGHLRLKNGRCRTILTTMVELKGHEERAGERREMGVEHGAFRHRRNWLERKTEAEAALGSSEQPWCVIIGGGQGGIALGARLKRHGVPTIILEKHARPGDSWRSRYKSLVLHDPVWYDHLPYLPFPDHWPVFTPKDKLGDWLEMYARIMELNYWGSSECRSARFNEHDGTWTLTVDRGGAEAKLSCKHLVFATGAYGPPNQPLLPGAASFLGDQYHASRHVSGERFAGKPCIVIGSNSSAHDICVDLWESGADVTMIQRSPTTVVRSETLMELGFGELYSEAALKRGITTEKADLLFASVPFRLMPEGQVPLYRKIAEVDTAFYQALTAAGFLHDFGIDGSGLLMRAWRTGSGYYIDVGGSGLIIRGEVKVRAPLEVKEIRPRSVVLTDETELPADLIVYATGYQTMDRLVARIVSDEVAARVGRCWGYGSGTPGDPGPWEGEVRNLWKPTAHPHLWFHGGNLHLSRQFSHYLALQLKARYVGLPTPVYGPPSNTNRRSD
jgi:putative flavoprotein involved in K+ transport